MQILGVLLTYNNLEYLKCSLKQALDFCDEVIIIEGGHLRSRPKRSEDGTCEYIKTLNHPKLVIKDFHFKGRNDIVQWKIRETISKESPLWESDNWVCQWDDDIAFYNDDLEKVKEVMKKTKKDMIRFNERMFVYNFRFNVYPNKASGYHFDRITKDCYYRPMWRMHYKNDKPYKKYHYMKDVEYFHYPFVKLPNRIRVRMECSYEKGNSNAFKRLDNFMKVKWEKDEDIFNYKDIIEEFTNTSGLNIYTGPHPEIMENHLWRNINDIREVAKSK